MTTASPIAMVRVHNDMASLATAWPAINEHKMEVVDIDDPDPDSTASRHVRLGCRPRADRVLTLC